jgi:hypothetical protein
MCWKFASRPGFGFLGLRFSLETGHNSTFVRNFTIVSCPEAERGYWTQTTVSYLFSVGFFLTMPMAAYIVVDANE